MKIATTVRVGYAVGRNVVLRVLLSRTLRNQRKLEYNASQARKASVLSDLANGNIDEFNLLCQDPVYNHELNSEFFEQVFDTLDARRPGLKKTVLIIVLRDFRERLEDEVMRMYLGKGRKHAVTKAEKDITQNAFDATYLPGEEPSDPIHAYMQAQKHLVESLDLTPNPARV